MRDVTIIARATDGYDVVKIKQVVGLDGKVVSETTERTREFAWQVAAWQLERKYPDH